MSFCLKSFYRFPFVLKVKLVTLAYKALDDLVTPRSFPATLPSPSHSRLSGLSSCSFLPLLPRLCPLCGKPALPSSLSASRCQLKCQLRNAVCGRPVSATRPTYTLSLTALFSSYTHHDLASRCSLLASNWLLPHFECRLLENKDLVCAVQCVAQRHGWWSVSISGIKE